jgi:hypothetical protein
VLQEDPLVIKEILDVFLIWPAKCERYRLKLDNICSVKVISIQQFSNGANRLAVPPSRSLIVCAWMQRKFVDV